MRPQSVKLALLLLLFSQTLFAGQPAATPSPQLAVENINKATEVLRDPVGIAEKTGQGIDNALPAVKNATPPGDGVNNGELKDPTLMNQNFRDALNRATQNKTGTGANGPAPAMPVLPKIVLLASICGGQKNINTALLDVNGKAQMVRAGDKITVIEKNQVMEIHAHYTKITVLPVNETLILQ